MGTAHQALLELCNDPQRRGRKECVELLKHEADDDHKSAVVARAALRATIEAETATKGKHSVQRAAELSQWEKDFLERYTVPGTAPINFTKHLQNHTGILKAELAVQHWGHDQWESEFVGTARQALRELCNDPQRRGRKECVNLFSSAHRDSQEVSGTSGDLSTMDAWSHNFTRELRKAEREMCSEPHRRDRPDCVKLLKSISASEKHEADDRKSAVAARAALRGTIEAEAKHWEVAQQRSVAQSSTGMSHWEREFLERYNISTSGLSEQSTSPASIVAASAPEVVRTSLRQGRRQLHWSTVEAWSSASWLPRSFGSGRGSLFLTHEDLASATWSGMLPKVACITAIRSSLTLQSQMKYFIDSFHQQTYEGPMQLIFVYHHNDHEAADVAHLYADGFHIKAVAAREDNDQFPSAMALRFGAWSAGKDAQVIMHWDFEAWHHPQRVHLQVRALAYSARPACVLTEGAFSAKGDIQEETLAGEAKWMHENWHPLLDEQLSMLQDLQQDQVVQVSIDDFSGGVRQKPGALSYVYASIDKHFCKFFR